MTPVRCWFDLIRVRQWTKNLLVFVPLFFAGRFLEKEAILSEILLFFLFSLLSSGVYIINDLHDLERDRRHPLKRRRPLVRGSISPAAAAGAAFFFILFSCGIAISLLPPGTIVLLASYLLLQVLYNLLFRERAGADVIVIGLGFVLRAAAGAVTIGVPASAWLILCTFFGAVRLALGKRQAELFGGKTGFRPGWESVSPQTLHLSGALSSAVLLFSYLSYCIFSATARRIGILDLGRLLSDFPPFLLAVPPAFFGVLRYEILAASGRAGEPEALIFRDAELFGALFVWILINLVVLALTWSGGIGR
ncbi:MAG: hypothetical protein D6679_00150 [Candidatus Hydrogenedentota bacterium]|nr:MAG: hypothetical protein D6679_00150 [Candidatus Hydrogenedentota bacterium]